MIVLRFDMLLDSKGTCVNPHVLDLHVTVFLDKLTKCMETGTQNEGPSNSRIVYRIHLSASAPQLHVIGVDMCIRIR